MRKQVKPDYGYDAPRVVRVCALITIILLVSACTIFYLLHASFPWVSWFIMISVLMSACGTLYPVITILIGSRILKFRERDWLLNHVHIQGDEHVLDVGCGRGLLLIGAAKKLKTGKAVGIDIWNADDQSGNTPAVTIENARLEGVANKIEVLTADARAVPFKESSFDIIISSWALHNISDQPGREKALSEIIRVLKPGGMVAIMDIERSHEYIAFLNSHGFHKVDLLGPRYTFGNSTYLVIGNKT